jgi:hypothetical protein
MKRVVVHVARDSDLRTLVVELQKLGGIVERAIPSVGIFGALPDAAFDRVRSLDGVKYVREEGRYQLPPADEKVPQ